MRRAPLRRRLSQTELAVSRQRLLVLRTKIVPLLCSATGGISLLLLHTDRIVHDTHQAQGPRRKRRPECPQQTRPPCRSPGASRRGSGGTKGLGCPSAKPTDQDLPRRGANEYETSRIPTYPEADRDVVARGPGAHDVAPDGVLVVRHGLARALDDRERVLPAHPNVSLSQTHHAVEA